MLPIQITQALNQQINLVVNARIGPGLCLLRRSSNSRQTKNNSTEWLTLSLKRYDRELEVMLSWRKQFDENSGRWCWVQVLD